jgi:hypothetical protein
MPQEPTEWAYVTQLKLDEEDSKLLGKCAEAEKLPKVEILRRALRYFAKQTLPPGSSPQSADQSQETSVAS